MQRLALALFLLALTLTVLWLKGCRFEPALSVTAPSPSDPSKLISETGVLTFLPFHEYPQISLKHQSMADAMTLYLSRLRADHSYDWEVALAFYGKVIDENGNPVADAQVHLDWNTVGVPGGTKATIVSSDPHGLFSLTGEHGKILGVLVQKTGYYSANGQGASRYFEYADPSSPYWHEPDAARPVEFRLRKKGLGADLFSKHLTIPVRQISHTTTEIDLREGFIRHGVLTIKIDTSRFLPGAQPFPWTVNLTMAEGGLVETDEHFPFSAPQSGYAPNVNFTFADLDRVRWQGGFTKTFYFHLPSTDTYGRIRIEASTSLPIELDEVYNVHAGDRNLEPREGSWTEKSSQERF